VKNFAESNGITEEETWERFKKHYDGYHFSQDGEDIYNPFSVLNAFTKGRIGDYWFRSGTPSFIVKLVRRNNVELGTLHDTVATESQLNNITDTTAGIVPLLYQAGYLTLKGWNEEYGEYRLGFPNEEVSQGFWDFFIHAYFLEAGGNGMYSLSALTRDIGDGDVDRFMERLGSLIADTPTGGERNKEIHFHNMMSIIGKMLGYRVHTEVVSSLGRCDMVLESRRYIYIFEFKINKSAKQALAQIKEKGYAAPYMADPREKILVGANFSTETRTLTDWVSERLTDTERHKEQD
ncbi:MAG: AAA family ATPase, partial [Bacteroidales bacterium]|nr:AAA family ATPase [Bacteroidales bacterium]